MSASISELFGVWFALPRRLVGIALRSAENPECISDESARARARSAARRRYPSPALPEARLEPLEPVEDLVERAQARKLGESHEADLELEARVGRVADVLLELADLVLQAGLLRLRDIAHLGVGAGVIDHGIEVGKLNENLQATSTQVSKLNSTLEEREKALAEYKARARQLEQIKARFETLRKKLDELTKRVIQTGLAEWSGSLDDRKSLIVRGQANLLKDVNAQEDLERIRHLFDDLERKRDLVQLLGLSESADGVRIFIGSENKLFSLSGSSLIVAPFHDERRKVVGVLGVIGPTRMAYERVIPIVDVTAKILGAALARR